MSVYDAHIHNHRNHIIHRCCTFEKKTIFFHIFHNLEKKYLKILTPCSSDYYNMHVKENKYFQNKYIIY